MLQSAEAIRQGQTYQDETEKLTDQLGQVFKGVSNLVDYVH